MDSGRWAVLTLVAAACIIGASASACSIQHAKVAKAGHVYSLMVDATLDASPNAAFKVLTQYSDLTRMSPSVLKAQVLGTTPDDGVRLLTWTRVCVLFFCKTMKQVQDMHALPEKNGGKLAADVIGANSDFSQGKALWQITPCGNVHHQSCLQFNATVTPKFWVPPLIGEWVMTRTLRQQMMTTCRGIERLAHDN